MNGDERLQIHELLSRAAYALDEREMEVLESCFASSARIEIRIAGQEAVGPIDGRDAIMQLMRDAAAAQTDQRRHVISNIFFGKCSEDAAEVTSNLTLLATENGVIRLVSAGLYRDRVLREDGAWRIAARRIELDLPY